MKPIRRRALWLSMSLSLLAAPVVGSEPVAAPDGGADSAAGGLAEAQAGLPRPVRPMSELDVGIAAGEGLMPALYAAPMAYDGAAPGPINRGWPTVEYHRVATGARSFPLYFEEVNAERYGYTCSGVLQPAISAAHFFGTIPYLPYLMTANCPRECVYTLGHYRPGSCNPWRSHSFPYRLDAATVEGAAIAGLIFLLP